ncbi:MAG: very short patch repair endonuclease [Candidatus Peribacteraceae bacterium]|nr:very short patch repair endonuclease [Candidatus Peribacteraceae bacterium]
MDTLAKEARSKVMRRVHSKETKLEELVFTAIRQRKVKFRKYGKVIGQPDIFSRRRKIAIFIDSCFWHGCRWHCRLPSSRKEYWLPKIERNKQRDKDVTKSLRANGWLVIRIWEHQLEKNLDKQIDKLTKLLA